jgi:hypothetical protein
MSEITQKRSQALPGLGRLEKILAVDLIAYDSPRCSTDAGWRCNAPDRQASKFIR